MKAFKDMLYPKLPGTKDEGRARKSLQMRRLKRKILGEIRATLYTGESTVKCTISGMDAYSEGICKDLKLVLLADHWALCKQEGKTKAEL